MAVFSGKWKVVNSVNFDEYQTAIKTSEEVKEKLRIIAAERKTNPDIYFEEYHYDSTAGTLRRTVFVKDQKTRENIYKIGVETDTKTSDGRPVKVTLKPVGDKKLTVHEKAADFEVDGFLEVKGTELTLSLTTSSGVTTVQSYTKIA